jgi:hypothetical protein
MFTVDADMEDPQLLDQIRQSSDSNDMKYFQLVDLTAYGLEDYIYDLRKRLPAIEESGFTAKTMRHEYRKIGDLLRAYEVHLAEHEALKCEESGQSADAVTKRRRLAKCSKEASALLAMSLRRHLEASYAMQD